MKELQDSRVIQQTEQIKPENSPWDQFLQRGQRESQPRTNQTRILGRRQFLDTFRNTLTRQNESSEVDTLMIRTPTHDQQHRLSNANRFQVRIPPSTSEEDRRTIVRYVNTFAEYTDRIVRRQSSRNDSLQSIDPENLRRSIMIQMADHSFTFSNNSLSSFVESVGSQMIVAFIDHARIIRESNSQQSVSHGPSSNRLTIYIVHERYISDVNQSTEIAAPIEDDSSTAYLELRSRLSGLRMRMEQGENRQTTNIITPINLDDTDILQDLQRTLTRLRSSATHFSTEQRNVRRRTIVNEEQEDVVQTEERTI